MVFKPGDSLQNTRRRRLLRDSIVLKRAGGVPALLIEIESRGARRVLKAVSENINKVSEETLKQAGAEAIERVKSKTPVRTGRLKRGHRMKMLSEKSMLLFNEVDYAAIVEFGHSGAEPQPHWRPAMEAVKKRFPELYAKNARQLADKALASGQQG